MRQGFRRSKPTRIDTKLEQPGSRGTMKFPKVRTFICPMARLAVRRPIERGSWAGENDVSHFAIIISPETILAHCMALLGMNSSRFLPRLTDWPGLIGPG